MSLGIIAAAVVVYAFIRKRMGGKAVDEPKSRKGKSTRSEFRRKKKK